MKVNCEIVQDLLPLYEDGVCSESSRAAIEEHLQECESCRGIKEGVPLIGEPEILLEPVEEKKAADGFKKVRRWWALSLAVIVLLVPLFSLSVNQFRGAGVCFTNLDDIVTAKRFLSHLQSGRYEKAAAMYDFGTMYQDIQSALARTPEDYCRQYEKIELGGEVWYMDENMADDFQGDGDALSVWWPLIYNQYYGVLIPEKAFFAVAEAEEGILTKVAEDIYDCANGDCFRLLETPWGNFFTEESNITGWNLLDRKLTDYGSRFTVMPEAMYLDVLPAMEAEAQRAYRFNQENYAPVAEMTEAEFCKHMRERYTAQLETGFEDVTITGGSYSVAYRAGDDGWQVNLNIRAASGAQANDLELIVFAEHGKVSNVGCSYAWSIDYSWLQNLADALHPGYLS